MTELRVGLLGGSFNPAHQGHLHLSLWALAALRLDRVVWLVSPQNPLKPAEDMAPFQRRLAVARRLARHPRIEVSDLERRSGTRYSVDTVAALCRRRPRHRYVWLIGADIVPELERWHRWQHIFELVPVAIFDRPTYARIALASLAAQRFGRYRVRQPAVLATRKPPAWCFVRGPTHPASATELRRRGAWKASGMEPGDRHGG
jgi:nicotinate-nucleotide adenylyltransferase